MAWTRKNKAFLRIICVCFVLVSVAKADELLWRVTNENDSEISPEYNLEPNPFPTTPEPYVAPVVEEEEEETVDPAAIAGADLLEKIRRFLASDKISEPNVSTIRVQGLLKGKKSLSVLIRNKWRKEGDSIRVPAKQLGAFKRLAGELEVTSPELWATIQAEVDQKVEGIESFKLIITEVKEDSVTLEDPSGESYVISFVAGGF